MYSVFGRPTKWSKERVGLEKSPYKVKSPFLCGCMDACVQTAGFIGHDIH